jgi:hypothetical protein
MESELRKLEKVVEEILHLKELSTGELILIRWFIEKELLKRESEEMEKERACEEK